MIVGIVDDDLELARLLAEEIEGETTVAARGEKALKWIENGRIDCLLTDLKMPGMDGMELIEKVQEIEVDFPIVMMTGHASIPGAVEAMKKGAWDYLEKPVGGAALRAVLKKIEKNIKKQKQLEGFRANQRSPAGGHEQLIGSSQQMQQLRELIEKIAPRDINVLIQGETGTGKELIARELHEKSLRSDAPLMVVNCAAIPGELLEGELFGYLKGAFTGAEQNKKGKLELAEGGTVFLDEIGELPLNLQPKLLRAIEQGEFTRLGGDFPRRIDVRFLAATNRNLEEEIKNDNFRKDLYYRLNAFKIQAPLLRDHPQDIEDLTNNFLQQFLGNSGDSYDYDQEVIEALQAYYWPGNVRELRNVVERAAILAAGQQITSEHLPPEVINEEKSESLSDRMNDWRRYGDELPGALDAIEKTIINQVLEKHAGNKSAAARELGISRQSLQYKLKK